MAVEESFFAVVAPLAVNSFCGKTAGILGFPRRRMTLAILASQLAAQGGIEPTVRTSEPRH